MRQPPLPALLGGGPALPRYISPLYPQPTTSGHLITWCCRLLLLATFPISMLFCLRIVNEYKRMVIFRLGKILCSRPMGPGIVILLPFIDDSYVVDLR